MAAVGVVVLTGCQMPFKCISRAELDKYRRLERLNEEQGAMITALTSEKERLTGEVGFLKLQLGAKEALLAARQRLLEALESKTTAINTDLPAGSEGIEVIQTAEGQGMRVGSDLLFDPGKAVLKPEGEKILKEAVSVIASEPNKIAVCGYTDSDPIKHSGWESNFELSGARALAVLNFLKEQGIAPERLSFRGYGQYNLIYDPAAGNEDKARSRRAEIIVLDSGMFPGASAKPSPAPVLK
jgi:flagellar motor protein MotB